LGNDPEIRKWFKSISKDALAHGRIPNKRPAPTTPVSDDESEVSSPDHEISKKDHFLINTMIKLHDTMDRTSNSKRDKEPGFKRLESHHKKLILNASVSPLFTKAADAPTEFFASFLAKKSQFKAKDMLLHQFHSDKIAFNPNSTSVTNLWNAEFFWILPDSPSGISIFYCPESKSSNSYELEKERNVALIDKVSASDIEKLAKQKITLPMSLMDLVWTTQNMHAVVSLCFGKNSHSASFLQGWVDHMYDNRILYSYMQSSDPQFFAKVMYKINSALQSHWRSCSTAIDRSAVNDNVLRLADTQEAIIGLNFMQTLPKQLADKVSNLLNPVKEEKNSNGQGKNGKKFPGSNQDNKDKQDLIYDNDKSHSQWKLKDNENFSKVFYAQQKECPKSAKGRLICMKFFIRGVCVKSCNRVHMLSNEDKKKFDSFISSCRAQAANADF
jgi:hypothetical protein